MKPITLKHTCILSVLGLLLNASSTLLAEQRPNIILAMADDQGWRDVGYNPEPGKVVRTPHMDQMVREGIRFNQFYSSSPNCSPTRAAVMTGRHCGRSGVFNPGFALRPEEITIAEILREAGYATGHFGKWHLGPVKAQSPFNPSQHGFDHFVSHDNFFEINPELSRNGAEPEKFSGDGSEVIVDETLKFIDSVADTKKPFFAVVWFGSPHKPHKALDKDKALYLDLPEAFQSYFGEITAMDRAMGTLRAGLKERGLDQNTLIWYTSDNGSFTPMDKITGLRGKKGEMWEGGIRVPGIIVWPEKITRPMITEMQASTSDIMPTILDLLDIEFRGRPIDGISLLPLLKGSDMIERSKPMGFWRDNQYARKTNEFGSAYSSDQLTGWWREFKCPTITQSRTDNFSGEAAWIEGKWKLHKFGNGKYELYDLEADQAETTDLSSQMPELVEKLATHLNDWQRELEISLSGGDYNSEPMLIFN